jgi:hypothetical protein
MALSIRMRRDKGVTVVMEDAMKLFDLGLAKAGSAGAKSRDDPI